MRTTTMTAAVFAALALGACSDFVMPPDMSASLERRNAVVYDGASAQSTTQRLIA